MKTIVIHPEIIAYHNSSFREPRRPVNKALVACALLLPIVAVGGWLAGRTTVTPAPAAPAPAPVAHLSQPAPAAPQARSIVVPTDGAVELQAAVDQGFAKADFIANGREHLSAEISNTTAHPLTVKISFGQMFESGRNNVVATRSAVVEIAPG